MTMAGSPGASSRRKDAAHSMEAPRRLAHGIDRTVNDMKAKTKCLMFNAKN
jgi:hypothetical protein